MSPLAFPRPLAASRLSLAPLFALLACGGPGEPQSPAASTLACPAPIGSIPRESCAEVGDEFGALSVVGALKRAGTGRDDERRIEAIRAAGALANALKEERLTLCERYDACKVPPAEHAARDKTLSGLMNALIKLWDGRQLGQPDGVGRFHDGVLALERQLGGKRALRGGSPAAPTQPVAPQPRVVGAEQLVKLESAGLAFKADAGGVAVTDTADDAPHDALRAPGEALGLAPAHRYQIRVLGTYAPGSPPPLAPGDEVVARVRYRASEPAELYVALRSLEDPEALDATTSWKLAAKESGSHEATFTASPGASGFYLGVGARSTGSIDLDDIELLRKGAPIAVARAEAKDEPLVKTSCASSATRPLAGTRSLRCGPGSTGDLVTLGLPTAHLYVAVRAGTGDKAVLRTMSLDGGRTLDATLTEKADLVIGLAGRGTATIRSIEVTTLE